MELLKVYVASIDLGNNKKFEILVDQNKDPISELIFKDFKKGIIATNDELK